MADYKLVECTSGKDIPSYLSVLINGGDDNFIYNDVETEFDSTDETLAFNFSEVEGGKRSLPISIKYSPYSRSVLAYLPDNAIFSNLRYYDTEGRIGCSRNKTAKQIKIKVGSTAWKEAWGDGASVLYMTTPNNPPDGANEKSSKYWGIVESQALSVFSKNTSMNVEFYTKNDSNASNPWTLVTDSELASNYTGVEAPISVCTWGHQKNTIIPATASKSGTTVTFSVVASPKVDVRYDLNQGSSTTYTIGRYNLSNVDDKSHYLFSKERLHSDDYSWWYVAITKSGGKYKVNRFTPMSFDATVNTTISGKFTVLTQGAKAVSISDTDSLQTILDKIDKSEPTKTEQEADVTMDSIGWLDDSTSMSAHITGVGGSFSGDVITSGIIVQFPVGVSQKGNGIIFNIPIPKSSSIKKIEKVKVSASYTPVLAYFPVVGTPAEKDGSGKIVTRARFSLAQYVENPTGMPDESGKPNVNKPTKPYPIWIIKDDESSLIKTTTAEFVLDGLSLKKYRRDDFRLIGEVIDSKGGDKQSCDTISDYTHAFCVNSFFTNSGSAPALIKTGSNASTTTKTFESPIEWINASNKLVNQNVPVYCGYELNYDMAKEYCAVSIDSANYGQSYTQFPVGLVKTSPQNAVLSTNIKVDGSDINAESNTILHSRYYATLGKIDEWLDPNSSVNDNIVAFSPVWKYKIYSEQTPASDSENYSSVGTVPFDDERFYIVSDKGISITAYDSDEEASTDITITHTTESGMHRYLVSKKDDARGEPFTYRFNNGGMVINWHLEKPKSDLYGAVADSEEPWKSETFKETPYYIPDSIQFVTTDTAYNGEFSKRHYEIQNIVGGNPKTKHNKHGYNLSISVANAGNAESVVIVDESQSTILDTTTDTSITAHITCTSFDVYVYPKKKTTAIGDSEKVTVSVNATLTKYDTPEPSSSPKTTGASSYSVYKAYTGFHLYASVSSRGEQFCEGKTHSRGELYTAYGGTSESFHFVIEDDNDPRSERQMITSCESLSITFNGQVTPESTSIESGDYSIWFKRSNLVPGRRYTITVKAVVKKANDTKWKSTRAVFTKTYCFVCVPELFLFDGDGIKYNCVPKNTFDFTGLKWYQNGFASNADTNLYFGKTTRCYGNYGMMDGSHTETFYPRVSIAENLCGWCDQVSAQCWKQEYEGDSGEFVRSNNGGPQIVSIVLTENGNKETKLHSPWSTADVPVSLGPAIGRKRYCFGFDFDFRRKSDRSWAFKNAADDDADFMYRLPMHNPGETPEYELRTLGVRGYAHTTENVNNPMTVCSADRDLGETNVLGPTLIDIRRYYDGWKRDGEDELTFPIAGIVGDYVGQDSEQGNSVSIGSVADLTVQKPMIALGTSYITVNATYEEPVGTPKWEIEPKQYFGLGRLFTLIPTDSANAESLLVRRGVEGKLSVTASKYVPVTIRATGIDQNDMPFATVSDWAVDNININTPGEKAISAVDSLSFFPRVCSVSATPSGDETIMWVNETKNGVYSDFVGVDDLGRELKPINTDPSAPRFDFLMNVSGLPVGAHGIYVSAFKDVSEGTRKGTIMTKYSCEDGILVEDFGNDTGLEIHRFPTTNNITLDYDDSQILIGPNEFITSDLLNRKFDMLYHDFMQVVEFSNSYDEPPAKYVGYIGWGQEFYQEEDGSRTATMNRYRLWNSGPDSSKNHPISQPIATRIDTIFNGCKSFTMDETHPTDTKVYACNYDITEQRSKICWNRLYNRQARYTGPDREITYFNVYNEVEESKPIVTSVKIGAGDKIFACAPQMNKIICYSKNTQQFLYDWGGYGGADSKLKFNGPTCISLNDVEKETDQFVYVLDGGNNCVKKYNNSGMWLNTIKYELNKGEHAVWMDTTLKGRIFVLVADEDDTNGRVIVLDESKGKVAELALRSAAHVRHIFRSNSDDFVYVVFWSDVMKMSGDGEEVGYFSDNDGIWIPYAGTTDEGKEFNTKFPYGFRCGYADKRGQVYLVVGPILMVYSDNYKVRSLYHKNANQFLRPKEDMHIGKQEYVQDWVFNTALQRMHDNINIIRRSVFAKVRKYKSGGAYIMEYEDISPEEYTKLQLVDKDNLYIPVNAPMSSMVINEQLKKLYDGICTLLSFAQDETEV